MGTLDGVRVIDFGQYIAGPLTAMLLADQGAEVIRVDPPSGPLWDTPANATWNRGKSSIALDVRTDDGRETARRLIASADVVVENFRPGVMDRLGLGPDEALAAHSRLIYCSLPGFASDDPRREVPAWEGVIGAATATYATRGPLGGPEQPEFRPVYTAIPTASVYAAFQAATAVGMALLARARDGLGQRIEVPLFDGMFGALGFRGLSRMSLRGLGGLRTTQYECGDGRWLQFHSGNKNVPEFMEAAGVADWRAEGLMDAERLAGEPELRAELDRRTTELFKTRTAEEWELLIAEAGSEATVCRTTAEWIEHPHALESEMVIEVEDPHIGVTKQPGINARLSETPGEVRGPAPVLDAQRDAILASLANGDGAAAAPPDEAMRAALDGVKVLDLCVVLAGPTCGRTLAEYGADVIKVDSPSRSRAIAFWNDVNRGKRSILLDLKSEDGQAAFWALVDEADVIVQNFRQGVAESLGVGYEQVRERRPAIVYASLNSYGHVGPWAGRPGHEQLAQAATGMQVRFGGEGPPTLQTNAVNDYGTGFMGAYAISLALLERQRSGRGQHVDSALAYTGVTLQSPFLIGHEGQRWDETTGLDALGDGPLHRAYRAEDGWLFLGLRGREVERFGAVEGLTDLADATPDGLQAALEERLPSMSVDSWVERLSGAGIGASRVLESPQDLMDDPWVIEHGLSVTREHDEIGELTTTGPAARLSRSPVVPGDPAPRPGSNARDILEGIGFVDRFDELLQSGAVRVTGVDGL